MFVSEYNDIQIGKNKTKQGSMETNECNVCQSIIAGKAVKGNTGVF